MNAIQIHLMINHFPIIGILLVGALFLYGLYRENADVQRWGLRLLIGLALTAVPVFFSGSQAEEIAMKIPGINESQIELHEEAAEAALIGLGILGTSCLAGLLGFRKRASYPRPYLYTVVFLWAISSILLAMAAHKGGLIRHPELKGSPPYFSTSVTESEH